MSAGSGKLTTDAIVAEADGNCATSKLEYLPVAWLEGVSH